MIWDDDDVARAILSAKVYATALRLGSCCVDEDAIGEEIGVADPNPGIRGAIGKKVREKRKPVWERLSTQLSTTETGSMPPVYRDFPDSRYNLDTYWGRVRVPPVPFKDLH